MESCRKARDSFFYMIHNENLDHTIKHLKEKSGKQPKSTHDIFTLYHYMEFIYKFTGNIACKKPIKFYKDIISFQTNKINSSKKAIHLVSEVFETKQFLTDRWIRQESPLYPKIQNLKLGWMETILLLKIAFRHTALKILIAQTLRSFSLIISISLIMRLYRI